jgi:chaperone required for assembly of F1-ATPase
MGNRSARHHSQRQQVHSSRRSQVSKSKNIHQQHIDTHYQTMTKVLTEHLFYLSSNFSDCDHDKLTIDLHGNALQTAVKHHADATYCIQSTYSQAEKIIYHL